MFHLYTSFPSGKVSVDQFIQVGRREGVRERGRDRRRERGEGEEEKEGEGERERPTSSDMLPPVRPYLLGIPEQASLVFKYRSLYGYSYTTYHNSLSEPRGSELQKRSTR